MAVVTEMAPTDDHALVQCCVGLSLHVLIIPDQYPGLKEMAVKVI